MPWKATDPLKERTKFLLEWERRWNEAEGGRLDLAELCRMFGISRTTGYAWIKRYLAAELELAKAVQERSRKPKSSPTAISEEMSGSSRPSQRNRKRENASSSVSGHRSAPHSC